MPPLRRSVFPSWLQACVVAIATAAGPAQAQTETPAPLDDVPTAAWHCWYEGGGWVGCVGRGPVPVLAPTASVSTPRSLRIPLYTEPFDTLSVAGLVQAVLCGTRADCRTRYEPQAGAAPDLTAQQLADLHDPLLQAVD